MPDDKVWNTFWWLMIVVGVVCIVLFGFRGLNTMAQNGSTHLGDRIGYNTKRISGSCYIELRPNVWVGEYNLANFLSLVNCEKE